MRKSKLLARLKYYGYLAATTVLLLLVVEGALRIFCGLPRGLYHFRAMDNRGLYLPNRTLQLVWAPIPYEIRTNSLGFRGPEITREKPSGITRIVALGDSVTDGFYVENENTYPFQLEKLLRASGCAVEVINAARGNSSIDREFEILRKYCMPLDPDMVVLMFVSNDIDELRTLSREDILSRTTFEFEPAAASEWLFFARTALGEWILDTSLKWRFEKYRTHRRMLEGQELEHRYDIPGGADFLDNCRDFLVRHAQKTDGIAFYETYSDAQMQVINNYLFALEHLHAYCRERGMRLIFVYYPEYPEIYMPDRHPALPDILREACAAQSIPFVNLTEAFRSQGNRVLHFAPLDYHPNPGGNRVMAQAIADFLITENLLPVANPG